MLWRYVLVPLLVLAGHVTFGDEDSDIDLPVHGCGRIAVPDYPGYYVQMAEDGPDWSVHACPGAHVFSQFTCACHYADTVYLETPTTLPPTTTMATTTTTTTTTTPTTTTTEPTTTTFLQSTARSRTTTGSTTPPPTTTKPTIKPPSTPNPTKASIFSIPKYKLVHFEPLPETSKPTTTATTPNPSVHRHDMKYIKGQRPCEGCRFDGGVGFNNHPTDCDKYVMCYVRDHHGNLTAHVRQCGMGKYWDQDLLTCRQSAKVACHHEKCLDNSLVDSYRFDGDCRGYWRCERGISIGFCCPKGQGYREGEGCIPDQSCNTPPCNYMDKPRADGPFTDCDKVGVEGDPAKFRQQIVGHGYVDMRCAPGTVFNQSTCRCETDTRTYIQPRACKKEMELEFNSDSKDTSGNSVHIQNINVTIDNGKACFHGNSVLVIPRFANVDIGRHLEIRIRYRLYDDTTSIWPSGQLQALLFNGDCGRESIVVGASERSSYFGLRNENNRYKSIHIRNDNQPGGWNEAVYSLHDNVMKTDVNNVIKTRTLLGGVKRSKCGLKIGWGKGYNSFRGCIDKISISFCPP